MEKFNFSDFFRERSLRVLRFVEAQAEVNGGIILPALQSSTVATTNQTGRIEDNHLVTTNQTGRIEDNHLVSTVSVSTEFLFQQFQPREIESLSENIDIRELDDRWRGENIRRFRFNTEIEDYLTTFTFPDNTIVFRCIQYFHQRNQGFNVSDQIIWNSRFTWRQIKQHLEDCTYNFDFRFEAIDIGVSNLGGERVISRPAEVPVSLPVAVDRLPTICKESENNDGVMCPICQEAFKTEDPAKLLPCKHLYHSKCILTWFRRKNSCPICRYEPVLLNLKNMD